MTGPDHPLSNCRPASPPSDLRARVIAAAEAARPQGMRGWLPAIAAAALLVLFAGLSYRIHAEIDARLAIPDELRPVEQWLPEAAGDRR
jgi:hypothetical protein